MDVIRVVVAFREESRIWVAQALDQDIAAQSDVDGDMAQVLERLGELFDARDHILETSEKGVEPLPAAPDSYFMLYSNGEPMGGHQLGSKRLAMVKKCRGE